MKQGLMTAAMALALTLSLTACGSMGSKPQTNSGSVSDNANGSVTDNGPGNGGTLKDDLNNDAVGNADGYVNDNAGTQARVTARRSSNLHRSAYDYLKDGRYAASPDGKVLPRSGDLGSELTQGARELIRDAKQLGKDLAKDAGDAVRSGADAARSTGRAAEKTIRDKMT